MSKKYPVSCQSNNPENSKKYKVNKMSFETITSQKGSENKCIVVLGFDNN